MSALKLWLTVTLATQTLSDRFGRFRTVSDRFRIVFEPFWTVSDRFRTILDRFGPFRIVFGPFRTFSDGFGQFSDCFGRFRIVFGSFRTVSDRFRTVFGPFSDRFGPFSDRFATTEQEKKLRAKNLRAEGPQIFCESVSDVGPTTERTNERTSYWFAGAIITDVSLFSSGWKQKTSPSD